MQSKSPALSSQQNVYGNWLSTFEWTHWTTLTTNYELTLKSARRITTGFYKELSRAGDTQMFWAAEPFDLKEGYHLHALIKIPDVLSFKDVIKVYQHVSGNKTLKKQSKIEKEAEIYHDSNNRQILPSSYDESSDIVRGKNKWNRIQLEKYDKTLGASHYIGKYITKELSDYDLIVNAHSRKY